MKKKLLSIFMSALLIIGSIPAVSAYGYQFNDVGSNHWAYEYICEMSSRGVLSGYPDGYFRPDKNVTRAEFAKIMTSAAGLGLYYPDYSDFADVSYDDWFYPYVEAAKYYLSGYETYYGYYYMPNDLALREDIAVAMVKLKGYSTDGYDLSLLQTMFTDWQSISSNAQKYVAVAVEKGLISGYDDGTFCGQNSITRAEAATLLYQAYKFGNDNKNFEPVETEEPSYSYEPETSTSENTYEPTQTYTPDEEENTYKLPYKVDSLAAANVSDSYLMATQDNNDNLYYYDSDADAVYKMNMKTGKKSEISDISELTYEVYEDEEQEVTQSVAEKAAESVTEEITEDDEDFEDIVDSDENSEEEIEEEETEVTTTEIVSVLKGRYKDLEVKQLYYNTGNDKLLLVGEFKAYKSEKSYEDKTASLEVVIDMDNTDEIYEMSIRNYRDYSNSLYGFCGNMDNGNIIQSDYGRKCRIIDIGTGKTINEISGISNDEKFCYSKGNKLYYGQSGRVYEYNFSQNKSVELWDDAVGCWGHGLNNKIYYSWDIGKGEIYKIASDGKPQTLNFNTITDVEVNDFYNMPAYLDNKRIFITNDESFVFYDKKADGGTWRKIEKQK